MRIHKQNHYTRVVFALILAASFQSNIEAQQLSIPASEFNEKILAYKLLDSNYDTINFESLLKEDSNVLVLFWFSGCTGCKMSLEDVLEPNYLKWQKEFNTEIVTISIDDQQKREGALLAMSNYPFKVFFDIEPWLYSKMPPVPLSETRIMKAFPTLMVFGPKGYNKSLNPFSSEEIEEELNK